ncbi:protein amalgam-like isoform X1 [Colias croceus]|uniref:protein amalgam-like isoform X1 n=1 Tax=Colias crocea TaxID=72248 RepID=UPI001E27C6BB|nr:protein amalgam-like isoform X1 [Colias croceus]
MELRRLSIYLALFVFVCVSQCTEARNTKYSGEGDDINYDDVLADEASDDEAQNDADGGNDADEDVEDAIMLTQATNYSVAIGRNVRLECKVSPADGVVVQWTRSNTKYFIGTLKRTEQDLKTYTGQDRFFIAANSTDLLIKDVQPSDSGTYRCEILQMNPPSVEHNIVITESPKVIRFYASDNGKVAEGSDLLLTCEAAGSPPPQILWSWDGDNGNHRLTEKDGEFTANSVFIRNVKRQNAGKYYCYVFNSVGNDQAELAVNVLRKPRVHVHRTVVNSDLNVEAVLECSIHDEPASHIRWYKDGRLIEDSSSQYTVSTNGQHSNLTVIPSSDVDFGTFTCEAENNLGKHNRSIELVQRPVVEDFTSEGTKLSWIVHSHQPLKAMELQLRDVNGDEEWRTLSVPLPSEQQHEYIISYSLDSADIDAGKYEVAVKVQNSKSWSEHASAVVDIEAQPEYIRPASVYLPSSAFSIRPSFALLPLIYVLVRF